MPTPAAAPASHAVGGHVAGGHVPGGGDRRLTSPAPEAGETVMVHAAARLGAVLGPVVVAVAWWLRGLRGGLTATGAVLLVVGVFAVTGWSLRWAARRGPAVLQAVALGGFGVRLGLYALAVVLLSPLEAVDGHALAVSTGVVLVALLAYEARVLTTRSELWWIDPEAGESAPAEIGTVPRDRPVPGDGAGGQRGD